MICAATKSFRKKPVKGHGRLHIAGFLFYARASEVDFCLYADDDMFSEETMKELKQVFDDVEESDAPDSNTESDVSLCTLTAPCLNDPPQLSCRIDDSDSSMDVKGSPCTNIFAL